MTRRDTGQVSLLGYVGGTGLVEKRIEEFIERHRPRWVYVFFSAGKDSSALLAAAARCCRDRVVAVFNHIVGQTHALNAQAALRVARALGLEVRRLAPRGPGELQAALAREPPRPGQLLYLVVRSYSGGLDYWRAVAENGFPAPTERWGGGVRWCCREYKEKWWSLLPFNGTYDGKMARYLAVGVKRSDSEFRRRRWSGTTVRVYRTRGGVDVALAPLADLSDADVWALLRRYGIHGIVAEQYRAMGHSPNCTLCPLMGRAALERTVAALPAPYLEHVAETLEAIRGRYKQGSFSAKRIDEWLRVIRAELERRGD